MTELEITIAGKPFNFNVDNQHIDNYFNAMMPDNKIAPLNNLLVSTIEPSQKEALLAIITDNSPAVMLIGGKLVEALTPKIDIEVKKL